MANASFWRKDSPVSEDAIEMTAFLPLYRSSSDSAPVGMSSLGWKNNRSCWQHCGLGESPIIRSLSLLACFVWRICVHIFRRRTTFFVLGVFATLIIVPNTAYWAEPDDMDRAFAPLGSQISSVNYPRTYLETVLPIPCHSHNDYWRKRPLWSALATGCISVEADVWLVDGEIYVGHSRLELREDRTLAEMYINPLIDILGQRNQSVGMATVLERDPRPFSLGIFPQDPQQSLVLLVDFKTEGRALWAAVEKALQPLREREWLTVWDGQSRVEGPVTVVASGNAPFDVIVSNTEYRDIFYDAPLEALEASEDKTKNTFKYNQSNSYYASAGMLQSFGPVIMNTLRNSQIELVRGQIKQARLRGLVPRYWGTPRWPRRLRDSIWKILFKEGTGVLNVDDLRAVRKDTWG